MLPLQQVVASLVKAAREVGADGNALHDAGGLRVFDDLRQIVFEVREIEMGVGTVESIHNANKTNSAKIRQKYHLPKLVSVGSRSHERPR
jgi:hypothetical protein